MEETFEEWFSRNESRFHSGQMDEKQIAEAAYNARSAEISRLYELRALDEQQFGKLKASFDEVVRQRDEYRAALRRLIKDRHGDSVDESDIDGLVEYWLDDARQAGEGEE